MSERLAVDIGGTFVDAIESDPETGLTVRKASTTPADPTKGVFHSIEKVGVELADVTSFVHGTTLGINSYLEREGATTGIITNEGHRDVFEIARISLPRSDMYNIKYSRSDLLVPRFRRLGVPGRLDADGEVLEPLDEDAVREAARTLVEERDVESIAICFLHAYQNPEHERRAAEVIEAAYPDVSISISSDISGELREYERTSTTVLDAYIKPVFEQYIAELDSRLGDEGFDGSFFVTRSGGGALAAENVKTAPIQTIMSGPAGGLIGAGHVGTITGRDDLIAADMGGTSLDTCVVRDGEPAVSYESSLDDLPIMIPVYDIRTIGAGGGSIAWVDGDLPRVGPQSAGADPGPICYGQGGTEPTVTDVAMALGYLDPDTFLGGELQLDEAAASDGIAEKLADPMGLSLLEASTGVFEVMRANTIGAIREITVEKGYDPRDFSLLAYGGAGPMVMPTIAREMGVEETLIPRAPGVFSAWGMLMADTVYDLSQTHITTLENTTLAEIDDKFAELEAEGTDRLRDEGFERDSQEIRRSVEMRYYGQEHSVEVNANDLEALSDLGDRFEAEHEARYGHRMDDPPEMVHLRVRAIGQVDKPEFRPAGDDAGTDEAHIGSREAYCFAEAALTSFDVYDRDGLSAGDTVSGPAIIQEPTTTTVFHSDQQADVDEYGHLIVTREAER